MFGKQTRFLTMIAAAVGIPYAWFNENLTGPVRSTWQAWKSELSSPSDATPNFSLTNRTSFATDSPAGGGAPFSAGGNAPRTTTHALADVLRFDVSPRWVTQQWPRVSTVHAQSDLEGLRVALVTGTNPHDLIGSLTYYFDRHQQVRRMTLHGHTGDERPLVALATQRFGMHPEASLSAGLFVTRWNGHPVNVLRISRAPVIRASAPHTALVVELEVNDPSAGHGLSRELRETLQYETHVRRWGD